MKKIGIFRGLFDPITAAHLEAARHFRKIQRLDAVLFLCEKDGGIADGLARFLMVKKAIRPYRCLKITEELPAALGKEPAVLNESEQLKEKSEQVRKGDFSLLPACLRRDVIESGIYADPLVRNMVNEHRYRHSLSVASLSRDIAEAHHLDSRKAWLIGMYHDIAKGLSEQQTDNYIKIEKPYEFSYPQAVWHAWVGYYLLKHVYGMKDKEMLRAVRHHCLGDDGSPLAMIVYLADKLESGRGYDSSKEIELAKRDLKAAFELVHQQQADYLASKEKV